MSLKDAKEQLAQLLADKDNRVIALSGKWGTGKTFLWEQVKAASPVPMVKDALYASLFGVSSIDEVKLKLIQSVAKRAADYPAVFTTLGQLVKAGRKTLEGLNKGFAALNELALIAAPAMLRQKLLVLDDIERKHDKLEVDEILGFIDEFTKRHNSRVVLILNDDQLNNRDRWDTLREKVIDQDLRLTTTAAEAFEIGIGLVSSPWAAPIRTSVELCGVSNIRVVCKVVKTVNRVLEGCVGLSDDVLTRVIPSTVLLASIHYKGIEDGPDFDFVLAQGTANDWAVTLHKKAVETDDEKRRSTWKILLDQLGISSCDEYELLLSEFLRAGMFDSTKLSAIIEKYVVEVANLQARNECHRFIEDAKWNWPLSEEKLLIMGKVIVGKANLLDAYTATALHDTLMEFRDGQLLADQVVDRWVEAFKKEPNLKEVEVDDFFLRRLHPKMRAELQAVNSKVQDATSVFDACEFIVKNTGWGLRQELAMKKATVEDFEATIRNLTVGDLQLFMGEMIKLCATKDVYVPSFGSAMDNFLEACARISQDERSPRLADLIKRLIPDANDTLEGGTAA